MQWDYEYALFSPHFSGDRRDELEYKRRIFRNLCDFQSMLYEPNKGKVGELLAYQGLWGDLMTEFPYLGHNLTVVKSNLGADSLSVIHGILGFVCDELTDVFEN